MKVVSSSIPEVKLIVPERYGDHRGFFAETYNCREMALAGLRYSFVQDNHSLSRLPNTVRGLHFQAPPAAQTKLVRCGRGAIFDVAVDIRKGSPTFGRWVGEELSAENGHQLLVPKGFAHGFMTLLPDSEIVYKCDDYYAKELEGVILWNDPEMGIVWPLDGDATVSEKDFEAPALCDFTSPFTYEEI